jgi:hypothetical protein
MAGITTYGSGWPVNATVTGDANQDGNSTPTVFPAHAAIHSWAQIMQTPTCA